MSTLHIMVLAAAVLGASGGVSQIVPVGQSLAAHSIDHSLAAQLVPAAPLLAPAHPPLPAGPFLGPAHHPQGLAAFGPSPFFARQPLLAHGSSPFFGPSPFFGSYPLRYAAPFGFSAPFYHFK